MKKVVVCVLALAILAAFPAFAANVRTIENGIDVWHTAGDGTTFVDFAKNPIPKGFFCTKSASFTGRVVLQGRPLATGNPGELGGADTIVQRLDDASFDSDGVASTRVQLRALQLESTAPVKTACGDFNIRVALNGVQPTTRMRIIKDNEVSGHFVAPIKVRFRISFLPTNGAAALQRELVRSFDLAPAPNATWGAIAPTKAFTHRATVLVDTDNDQIPDTYLPKSSGNFFAGMDEAWLRRAIERQRLEKRTAQEVVVSPGELQPEQPVGTCSGTLSYDGYGSYQCNSGTNPQCHPEAQQAQHCAQPCPPCYYSVVLQPSTGTLE